MPPTKRTPAPGPSVDVVTMQGPPGEPGPAGPGLVAFQGNHAYAAGEAMSQGGMIYTRNAGGTSRATFDATEQANWSPLSVASKSQSVVLSSADADANRIYGTSLTDRDVVNAAADLANGKIATPRRKTFAPLDPLSLSYLRGAWSADDPRANGGASLPTSGSYEAWSDLTGGVGALSQGSTSQQPKWTANQMNGLPAWVWGSGANVGVTSGTLTDAIGSLKDGNSAGVTVIMVTRMGSTGGAQQTLLDTTTGRRQMYLRSDNKWSLYGGTAEAPSYYATGDVFPSVMVASFGGGGFCDLRRNGASVSGRNQPIGYTTPMPTRLFVGFNSSGNQGMAAGGAISALYVVNRLLTREEIRGVEEFLIGKWRPDKYLIFGRGGDSGGLQPLSVVPGPTTTLGDMFGYSPPAFSARFSEKHNFVRDQLLTAKAFVPTAWNGDWVVAEVISPYEIIVRPSVFSGFSPAAANTAGAPTTMGAVSIKASTAMHVFTSPDGVQAEDRHGQLLNSADYSVAQIPNYRNGESFKWTNPDGSRSRYYVASNTDGVSNGGISILRCDDPIDGKTKPLNWYQVAVKFPTGRVENTRRNSAWGLTAFIDTAGDGNLHVIVPSGSDNVDFTCYETHPLTSDLTGAWSPWVPLTFTGSRQPLQPGQSPGGTTAIIDPFIFPKGQINSNYNLTYKREAWALPSGAGGVVTGATWSSASGGRATITVGTAFASVVYVGGHIELGARGTKFAPNAWNGIYPIVAVDGTAGTITVTMTSDPGATTTVGDVSIEFHELASAPAITGPYTVQQIGNWAGWGRAEAIKALVRDANNIQVYFDCSPGNSNLAGTNTMGTSVTSTGLTGNGAAIGTTVNGAPWSAPTGTVIIPAVNTTPTAGYVAGNPAPRYQVGSVVPI